MRAHLLDELARLRRVVVGALWGRLPEASLDFDRTRLDAEIFEEVIRIRKLVLRSVMAALNPGEARPVNQSSRGSKPRNRAVGGKDVGQPLADQTLRVFESLQLFVLQHPVAAQKIFSSLVAEGRRFADSEEGGRWARALGRSSMVRRARQLWESSVASVLDDDAQTILPSEYVELLLQGAKLVAPEELGARMSDRLATSRLATMARP